MEPSEGWTVTGCHDALDESADELSNVAAAELQMKQFWNAMHTLANCMCVRPSLGIGMFWESDV